MRLLFQSTCPQGARRKNIKRGDNYERFNPRARKGHDPSPKVEESGRLGFNPRARKGHDLSSRSELTIVTGFNPRARKGHDCHT